MKADNWVTSCVSYIETDITCNLTFILKVFIFYMFLWKGIFYHHYIFDCFGEEDIGEIFGSVLALVIKILNRPGVARAVLQTPLSLIN